MFGAPGHVFGGAVAEEAFGKFVAAIGFAAFFHLRQPTDVSRGRAQLRDLILLILIGLGLLLALGEFLFKIIGVVARIGFDAVRIRIKFENGCDRVIQKGAVVRDDQCCALESVLSQSSSHSSISMSR